MFLGSKNAHFACNWVEKNVYFSVKAGGYKYRGK